MPQPTPYESQTRETIPLDQPYCQHKYVTCLVCRAAFENNSAIRWLACAIDSEGTVAIKGSGSHPYKYFSAVITVANTNLDYIKEVYQIANGGNFYSYQPKQPNAQLMYGWQAKAHQVITLGESLLPHMIIKKEQIRIVTQFSRERPVMTPDLGQHYYKLSRHLNGQQFLGYGPGRPRKGDQHGY